MHKLFKSDDCIVKGRLYKVDYEEHQEQDDGTFKVVPIKHSCIELDFAIRINGKLCDFTESFSLQRVPVGDESVVTIREWSNWYLLLRMLQSFGYLFTHDNPEGHIYIWNDLIAEWIETALSNEPFEVEGTVENYSKAM